MNYTREEVLQLIRSAFNEGFNEGMRECTSSRGGKTWAESRTLERFDNPTEPKPHRWNKALSSPQGGR